MPKTYPRARDARPPKGECGPGVGMGWRRCVVGSVVFVISDGKTAPLCPVPSKACEMAWDTVGDTIGRKLTATIRSHPILSARDAIFLQHPHKKAERCCRVLLHNLKRPLILAVTIRGTARKNLTGRHE
jgi:hypothetical protein